MNGVLIKYADVEEKERDNDIDCLIIRTIISTDT